SWAPWSTLSLTSCDTRSLQAASANSPIAVPTTTPVPPIKIAAAVIPTPARGQRLPGDLHGEPTRGRAGHVAHDRLRRRLAARDIDRDLPRGNTLVDSVPYELAEVPHADLLRGVGRLDAELVADLLLELSIGAACENLERTTVHFGSLVAKPLRFANECADVLIDEHSG